MARQVAPAREALKFKLLAIGLAALTGWAGVVLSDQFGHLGLLLISAVVLLILSPVLLGLSRRWWARNYALSIVVPVMFIGIWLTAQVWYYGLPLTWPYLGLAVRWKNNIGVLAVTVGMLFIIHRSVISRRAFFLFLVSLPFLVVATITIQRQQEVNWPLLGMYAGWLTYVYLVVPGLLRTRRSWLFAVRTLIIMSLLPLAWYIWSGISTGSYYWLNPNRPRVTFVFNSPHNYGGALLVGLVGTIVLVFNSNSHKPKRRWLTLAVVLSTLLVLSYSRSNLVFLGIFVLTVGIYTRWRFRPLLLSMLIMVTLLTILAAPFYLDYDQIDDFSSGRLSRFSSIVHTYLTNAPLGDWLFGTSFQSTYEPDPQLARARHIAVATERYRRAHIENMYLQLFLSHGLSGLLTFVMPFLVLYFWLHRSLKTCQTSTRINIILAIASINGLAAYSLTADSVPSFGNSLAIFMPILWLPPLLHCPTSRKTDGQSADETILAQSPTSMQDTLSQRQKAAGV